MAPDRFERAAVVVSGGAGGIGQAVTAALIARGAQVAVLDVDPPEAATVALSCDVTDAGAVDQAARSVIDRLGVPDHVVCAAGVVSEHPIDALDPVEWRRVLDVSLTGTYLVTRALVPDMAERGTGSVVALSSGYATAGYRYGGHYAAAKAGVEAYAKSLALEVAARGVRVNVVAPGPVLTGLLRHIGDLDAWRIDRAERIPLGRVAEPADLVGPILFLLGPESAYMTGQVIHVDGGLHMP